MTAVHRLDHRVAESWAWYPVLEARALAFIAKHDVKVDPAYFRAELRGRFMDSESERHRLYLFLDDTGVAVGHFLAWVDVAYNRPYVHVNQVEADEGLTITDAMERMFDEVDVWVETLNRNIPEGHPMRVDSVSWWTWHPPEVFARYLRRGCELKIDRYVLRYTPSQRRRAKRQAELH